MSKSSSSRNSIEKPESSFWREWLRMTAGIVAILIVLVLLILDDGTGGMDLWLSLWYFIHDFIHEEWRQRLVMFALIAVVPLGAVIALPVVLVQRWKRGQEIRRMEQQEREQYFD